MEVSFATHCSIQDVASPFMAACSCLDLSRNPVVQDLCGAQLAAATGVQVAEEREVCAVGSELRLTAGRRRDSQEVCELVWKDNFVEWSSMDTMKLALACCDPVSKQASVKKV